MREIGRPVEGWRGAEPVRPVTLRGAAAQIEPLTEDHASALHAAFAVDDTLWDYMFIGPFAGEAAYRDWVAAAVLRDDPCYHIVTDLATGRPGGVASLMRIDPAGGSVEVGGICFSPELQRTRAASEAIFLFAEHVFGLGYRRFEWKCNALNAPSRRAAQRFGFSFEGVFRNHLVVKGCNRDTAWFAMTREDWTTLRRGWLTWLAPENFDAAGRQRRSLGDLTAPGRVASDPWLT